MKPQIGIGIDKTSQDFHRHSLSKLILSFLLLTNDQNVSLQMCKSNRDFPHKLAVVITAKCIAETCWMGISTSARLCDFYEITT